MGVDRPARAGSPMVSLVPSYRSPGPRGFLLHPVTKASPAPPHQYYVRICHPLIPSHFRISSVGRFSTASRSSRRQIRRASLGKAYRLPTSRPAPRRFGSTGYRASSPSALLAPSPTPSSWFAVRYVRGFYLMLPPDIPFRKMPLPCWCSPSVPMKTTSGWILSKNGC